MENNGMKRCAACKLEKTADEFYYKRVTRRGKSSICKECADRYCRSSREEKRAIYRENILKNKYGITFAEKDKMLALQGGLCAICGIDNPGGIGFWNTDHDHKTGKVRGILCNGCNLGLGNFQDNPGSLIAAVEYLAIHR